MKSHTTDKSKENSLSDFEFQKVLPCTIFPSDEKQKFIHTGNKISR